MIHWEDFEVGQRMEGGSRTVSAEEIVAFAAQWDPQPFHIDESAAKASIFGGLVASGWHTACIAMRLAVDGIVREVANLGSPGVDEIRWLVPVRPGDTLTLSVQIVEKEPSSRPDRGKVKIRHELRNQKGEVVMTMVGRGIVRRRR